MKKKILLSFVSIFVLCTSFVLPVSATNSAAEYFGTFNGKEYPIRCTDLNSSSYAVPVGSFEYSWNVADINFNNSYWFSSTTSTVTLQPGEYYVGCVIYLPELIPANNEFSLSFSLNHTFASLTANYIEIGNALASYRGMFDFSNSGSNWLSEPLISKTENTKYINVRFMAKVTVAQQVTFNITSLNVTKSSSAVDIELGLISDMLEIISLNLNEIGINVIDIRSYCISILSSINDNFSILHDKIESLKSSMISKFDSVVSTINSNFTSLNSWIQNQTTSITSKLNDLLVYFKGNEQSNSSVDKNNQSSNNAGNTFDEYNDLESGYMNDMTSNLGSIDTSNNLFGLTDFMATGTFVSTQLENIYNSNPIVQNVIMYGLILGLAFTVIGISTKWG